ncbi:dihydrofolate synthase / folylpolyglutamate synthase [Oceanospirillum multiglobuliferum]|uniref:Dihydrofolate synthase/folylpolyglutamate synthase n=1 Tax=Oceanospirillum multiglobuliferum TaxID=64969 RepID=A0A1T4LKE7_9GAMM|nr:bifunctional tetrahydrofolate synthase/dihydrofolate synthase [Oceanospirillum multiglobuliferum]OPX56624.1 bifunctional tetrahydrofolate synthase/dihydrofolate synthase [Oceanospirillum multiglobuliferum]SJZ55220.1 dihydrofolate synthase / folylpolyglutamate synthase [Oceanospirillum multiglobuliferum]
MSDLSGIDCLASFSPESANLQQWLAYLEALHPSEIDLGLDRLRQVAERLQVTTLPCDVITVAGTNGKGSTVAMLDSVLRHAGYRVGCYTSPHFLHYNERICLEGKPVSDDLICQAFCQIEQARAEISLTYFEFGTLAAFLIFAEQKPDFAILEVGLGGRLDAVNLIDPDVAIVTTIAKDHESWLGSDLEQIGREKAGIFRPNIPALLGAQEMPASVRATAQSLGASCIAQIGQDYRWQPESNKQQWQWQQLNAEGEVTLCYQALPKPALPLDNAATVIQAVQLLNKPVAPKAIYQGLANASLTGRMQRIGRFLLDVAHNPHAAQYVAARLQEQPKTGRRVALLGMLDDKDIESVLEIMAPEFDAWYIAQLSGPRATPVQRVLEKLSQLGCDNCQGFTDVSAALAAVLKDTSEDDNVLVFGSFYTVAGVLAEKERLTP